MSTLLIHVTSISEWLTLCYSIHPNVGCHCCLRNFNGHLKVKENSQHNQCEEVEPHSWYDDIIFSVMFMQYMLYLGLTSLSTHHTGYITMVSGYRFILVGQDSTL